MRETHTNKVVFRSNSTLAASAKEISEKAFFDDSGRECDDARQKWQKGKIAYEVLGLCMQILSIASDRPAIYLARQQFSRNAQPHFPYGTAAAEKGRNEVKSREEKMQFGRANADVQLRRAAKGVENKKHKSSGTNTYSIGPCNFSHMFIFLLTYERFFLWHFHPRGVRSEAGTNGKKKTKLHSQSNTEKKLQHMTLLCRKSEEVKIVCT